MNNYEKAKELLFDLFSEYETYEDIMSSLRSLNTEKVINDKEYNYVCENYDELLENWLTNYKEKTVTITYKNNKLEINSDYIKGSIKDLKEYFRYEIASQCVNYDNYENFSDNIKNIIELLDNLYEDTNNNVFSDNDIMIVKENPMGGFIIESEV